MNWLRFFLLCALLSVRTTALRAQPPILNAANGDVTPIAGAPTDGLVPQPDLASPSKREQVAEELRVAQRTLDSAKQTSEENNVKPPERLQREVELLKQLEVVVAQNEAAKTEHLDQKNRISDFEGQLAVVRESGPPEENSSSFLFLDHLRDDLATRQTRTATVDASVTSATEAIARAKLALETKEQAYRRAKEVEQSNTAEDKKAELANATKFAELEVRIATIGVEFKKQEEANQQLAQQLHQRQIELLEEKIRWVVQKGVVFSQEDLDAQLIEIAKQEDELRNDKQLAESNLGYAEGEWSRARQQLDAKPDKDAALAEQVEAKLLAKQLYQTQVSVLTSRLERRGGNRQIWDRRFAVIRGTATTDELITWDEEARARLKQLDTDRPLEQNRINEARQDLVAIDKEYQAAGEEATQVRRWIQEQRDLLTQLIQVHDANIVSIEASRQLTEKLLAEIGGDVENWTLAEWLESARHHAATVWNMEVTTVDDHSLTVGKLLLGVFLIFCGFVLARMLSRTLGYRLQQGRIRMNESGAAALQSLSFYVLLVCFTLTALRFVNVPLTMFTFLGGAIAIGVGFGSQNILNNFISGLILLAERPIKVGDLIQIDELYGNVEHIGARSTIIRTGNNLDIIVPNSTFLENNVVNLTRGDDKLRTNVKVGIAYGSPTRDATKLMKHAAVEHGRILNSPEPFVWFVEFGDNSLNFEVHFWVKVRSISDRTRIESDVRFRIDQLFRDAGITIAFPQRDIHIDASTPIPIRMIPHDERDRLTDSRNSEAA
ncbi:MAG: mechanosensitive ion channel [Planctomycetaceae bacterium]|nr:mechanosensitive ion channel [Planctomycetales bacterium]MCB9875906.1 mechanosensitive ion channel [Planctomycetaceae bacterium]MCB9941790.1 mechanosensitive ion channel [Planctomycetaceae bacterium]